MKLSLVYFNDVHGYLQEHPELFYEGENEIIKTVGGYSRVANFIQSVRKENPNTLVFDGGDTFHGTLPVVESKGEILLPILSKLGISAMVGHWDFAYGPEHLVNLTRRLNYPVLGCNVYQVNGERFLPPYIIQKVEEVKIGIIGICCNIIDKTMPKHFSQGIYLTDGREELPKLVEEVKNNGANIIILLSHNGFPQDCYLLSHVKGIDICLSAHTHNRLYEAVTINDTMILQCGCHGSFAGRLDIEIEDKQVTDFSYQLVALDEAIPKDEAIEQYVQQALEPYQHLHQKTIATTPVNLHRYHTLYATLDNLLLAAIASASGCRIAFSNGWRYGIPIPAGAITTSDLYNIIPMNPPVSTVELTGKEIKDMLEENLERTFSTNPMSQMGGYAKRCLGIEGYIKIENPKGARIQELFIEGKRAEKNKVYQVAFVTSQGVPEHYGTNRSELAIKAVEAMLQFLQSRPNIDFLNHQSFVTV